MLVKQWLCLLLTILGIPIIVNTGVAKRDIITPSIATLNSGNRVVKLTRLKNGWQLLVHGKLYFIKGIAYDATTIGQSPGTLIDWRISDVNGNGITDGPYESWIDVDGNGQQDKNEPTVGDFQLLKELNADTIRIYHPLEPIQEENKKILRELYKNYGIRVLFGNFFGAYTISSGATWDKGTDYLNKEQKEKMLKSVRDMVEMHKNEEYVLIWVLGNENNLNITRTNANTYKTEYAKFLEETAKMIHKLDPNHPVAACLGGGGTMLNEMLQEIARHAPSIDIIGLNAYISPHGFGNIWKTVKNIVDRPIIITEFGCDAWDSQNNSEDQEGQATYILGNWKDIEGNRYGYGEQNSLGGVVFQWADEWWKAGADTDPNVHDKICQWKGPAPDGCFSEEWLGITSQGSGNHSPFERRMRQAHYTLQSMWKEKEVIGLKNSASFAFSFTHIISSNIIRW